MKENISIEKIDYLSHCLSKSLIKTLELSDGSKVFSGNEEKFLFFIFYEILITVILVSIKMSSLYIRM